MHLFFLLLLFQKDNFYTAYEAGSKALEAKDYTTAISQLEKAIALRADSSPNARTYGVQMQPYFPYHRLAWAHLLARNFDKSRKHLDSAFEQLEHQQGDKSVATLMEATEGVLGMIDLGPQPKETPKEAPNLITVTNLLLSDNLEAALGAINLLLTQFPKDKTLQKFRDTAAARITEKQKEAAQRKEFQNQLENLLKAARQAEVRNELEVAYQRYSSVLRFDAANSEAQSAIDRIQRLLQERGKSQSAIEAIISEKKETDETVQALMQRLAEQETESNRLRDKFNNQVSSITDVLKLLSIKWNLVPQDGKPLTVLMRPVLQASHDLVSATLFVNGREIKSWPISKQKGFSPSPLELELPRVNNDLRLRLVDARGNVLDEPYDYNFPVTRPFFTARVKTVLAIAICALIGTAFFTAQRRRRNAFRARFNPYVAGAPILNEKMFYGRSPILKQILNALHNNSLMIFGERRIGKTSFLHRLHAVLPSVDDPIYIFIPVFIDLQGVREQDFFGVLDNEIGQVLVEHGVAIESPEETITARVFTSRLRKSIGLLKERLPKKPKLVLLLDEVDIMNGYSEQTNQQLRSVFMKGFAEHIVAVMAGIHINTRWKSEGSPWYNFFEQIELKPFPKQQATDLIMRPVDGIYTYTDDAIQRIMEITDGKPYLIQKMCLNLVSYILLNNRRKITAKEVDIVFKDIEKEFYGA